MKVAVAMIVIAVIGIGMYSTTLNSSDIGIINQPDIPPEGKQVVLELNDAVSMSEP